MLPRSIAAAAALAVALGTGTAAAETVRMAVTDIAGMEDLQREFGAFQEALAEATGYEVELFPVNSRTAAVEAMRADQLDFVLTGPAEYVVFQTLTDAEVVVGWQRPDYFAQIVTLADGPVQSVEDLRGETVSFGDVGSTSQHLAPAQVLADYGLMYGEDYEPVIINRNVAVEALIRGDIAAIGMNFDHLRRIREAFPETAFQVVARGRDLPNDVLIVAPDVPDEVVETVRNAFIEHQDALMAAVLEGTDNRKYEGGHFLPSISDEDYEYVRSMYRTIGVPQFSEFVGE
jgi:phosphonate transport system substrate-binding protein